MLIGRNRYRTHGGIPHGSTTKLNASLVYYQWKNNCSEARWDDQSGNANHLTQSTGANQAALTADGALAFTPGNADHYDLSSDVALATEEGFVVWTVIEFQSTDTNQCLLGMGTAAHFFEFKGGADLIRIKLHNTATEISPGDGNDNDFAINEKMLVTVHREGGGTGNINVYKNGVILAQDSQVSNTGDGEFNTVAVRSGDRYLAGTLYDLAIADENPTTAQIERVNSYLTAKHGLI
tara:strand:+ start:355 stop:1065 length:711 start_codon:yes stop_codon:yes gene_type:complete